jgi:hypothetical protein
MSIPCPHCSAAIDGWVPLDRVDSAAKARDAAIAARDAAVEEAKGLRKSAAAYDALKPAYDELVTKSAGLDELRSTVATLKAEKVDAIYNAAGIRDAKIRKLVEMEFDEQATADGGEKDVASYLAKLQALPVAERPAILAPFLAAPPAPGAGVPPAAPPPAPGSRLPPATPAAVPPASTGRVTQATIAAVLSSPEYRALPSAEKTKRLDELQRQAQQPAAPVV